MCVNSDINFKYIWQQNNTSYVFVCRYSVIYVTVLATRFSTKSNLEHLHCNVSKYYIKQSLTR